MKLKNAKIIALLLTLAGLAACASVLFLLFIPSFKENLKLSAEITAAYGQLGAQYAHRKNLLINHDRVETARETMKRLGTQFLPVGREIELITAIEALAAKNGIEERITLSRLEGGSAPELKVGFSLALSGPSRGVMQMLIDLEKLPTLLITDAVEVRTGGTDAGPVLFINVRGTIVSPPNGFL